MSLRVTLLGTGTSHGVPMIGCECAVCRSSDPHDRRTRPSILLEADSARRGGVRSVLVDTSTDLREQALTHRISRVDAILFTHSHADHILGLDEVRRFNVIQKSADPVLRGRADARRSAADVLLHLQSAGARGRRAANHVVQDRRPVRARPARDRSGAAAAWPSADPRIPHRRVRLPDRLQPHPGRVVAAARWCAHPRAGRPARSAAPDPFQRRGSARRRVAPGSRAHLLHAHLPRSAARRHLRPPVRRVCELAYDGLVLET